MQQKPSMIFKVAIYSGDQNLISLIEGLIGTSGTVLTVWPETASELPTKSGHLVLVDMSFPNRIDVLERLKFLSNARVLAIVSANPFVLEFIRSYAVDAVILKPLHPETVQALLVGAKARMGFL